LKIFDCDASYGRGTHALPREIETPAELARELDRFGIAEALVWHRDAYLRDFNRGNRRLTELAGYPNLHPTMTMAPTCCDEMPSADGFLEQMRAGNIRAVRAFPTRHYYLLDRVSCGDLFEGFMAAALPLFVPLTEFPGQWQGVYALLRDFPDLTLVLTETGCWGQDRYFRPLMRQYPRFHITTSRLETAGQLQDIVNSIGPERILFASGLPVNTPGGSIMMVARAPIAEDAKEAIANGNLERILEEVNW